MKSETRIRQTAIGCLLIALAVVILGCHGPRSRYALFFRKDFSAELWKFPGEESGEASSENFAFDEMLGEDAIAENGKEEYFPEESCNNESCATACETCPRPRLMGGRFSRLRANRGEEECPPEPPPMIAASFFPVPTRPVFTPRGNLMDLNPHLQGIMSDSSTEIVPPGVVIPETMSQPVPKLEVLPTSPTSEPSKLQQPSSSKSSSETNDFLPPLPLPPAVAAPSHWIFLRQTAKRPETEKAYELIASGSRIVK